MRNRIRGAAALLALSLAFANKPAGAQARSADPVASNPAARLVDSLKLDPGRFDEAFGGISGIDYDRRQRRWLLLSDDRSEHAPARWYAAQIVRGANGRWRIRGVRRQTLADTVGQPFPAAGTGREAVDPEAIRMAPDGRGVIWSSEGDAKDGYGPAVRRADRRGRTIGTVNLPANLRLDPAGRRGTRDNGTLEGIDFAPDGALWLAMEAPLIEDGLPAGDGRTALVRFTRLRAGDPAQQYAYRLDATPRSVHGKSADNGVTEMLMLDARRALVIERSGAPDSKGRFLFHCRLYLADFTHATEMSGVTAVSERITPAAKRLLYDFDAMAENPGNLEAMAWWPSPKGRRDRIILVNDNNFVDGEPTRLLLLALPPELVPPRTR